MLSFIAPITSNSIIGNRQLSGLPFVPTYIRFTVGQKLAVAEGCIHKSEGSTDLTTRICHSTYWDGAGGDTFRYTGRVINHIGRVGGVLTDLIVVDNVSVVNNGPGDIRLNMNFIANTSGYKIDIEFFG